MFFILLVSPAIAGAEVDTPTVESEAAILIEATSGDVLYAKNEEKQMYPASITKIATAIYAIENGNLQDVTKVSERAREADGTRVYLEAGEEVSLDKLVKGLLINSGNDAGIAIAEHLSGSVEQFAVDLNKYLKENVNIENTHFTNPHGLFNEDHYTTASDMAKITAYAIRNQTFSTIFGMKKMDWDGQSWDTTLYNHHKLLISNDYPEVVGGKNGFVNQSGFTLVTNAQKDGLNVIVVTMKASYDRLAYQDTIELLTYGFDHFAIDSVVNDQTYEYQGDSYELSQEQFYVKYKDEKIEQNVKGDSMIITGEDGRTIKEIGLQKVEFDEKSNSINQSSFVSSSKTISNNLIYGVMVLFLVTCGIYFFKVAKL
ncbi:D-alanyl-D-alanine carboxypeptidase family protein [Bacillus carboniphilus]|uniref:D-alanyl-D-alanine carboxypeptidase family protein n=1 Tax=Bacillus carboniphilus TaxID=86663 RepID=A0ABY9JPW0_9BACI|nr:D-alanyl-D-alanine carboxypeptidase family protein [Bacillus carboniphilus]WLR41352.1 D-alanyl-D-alanine carboxypeptidase family protein [Bacillus carboniphilus]